MANKQSSSGTTKPGCSFCLPPDSHLCFILVAELKQRAAGDPLPTATTSWGNSPLTEGFPSFGILIAGAFPSQQDTASHCPNRQNFSKIAVWEAAPPAFTQLQSLVLQGMFQSRCHQAVTPYFGGGSVTLRVVAVAGSAQSQVPVLW